MSFKKRKGAAHAAWVAGGCLVLALFVGPPGRADQDTAGEGYYLDQQQTSQSGGVGNYLFHYGSSGPVASLYGSQQSKQEAGEVAGANLRRLAKAANESLGFKPDQAKLEKSADQPLAELAAALSQEPKSRICVTGYSKHDRLSKERAISVKKQLVADGARSDQIETLGKTSGQKEAENHRAEITILHVG